MRTPLPGADGVEFIVHAGPQLGAQFTQMTAELRQAARWARAGTAVHLCARRRTGVEGEWRQACAGAGGFAFLPQGTPHTVRAPAAARAAVIEKPYESNCGGACRPQIVVGR